MNSPSAPSGAALVGFNAITLATHDMARAVAFYRTLGFVLRFGGPTADFSSFAVGESHSLNLILQPPRQQWQWWGRVIIYVNDVDAFHAHAVATGLHPEGEPRDASWGERYFHIMDPDGHELSFARPIAAQR